MRIASSFDDGTLADAMSKAAFVLGATHGIALIDAMPGMAGVIAYRKPDGTLAVAASRRIAWQPVDRTGVGHPVRASASR